MRYLTKVLIFFCLFLFSGLSSLVLAQARDEAIPPVLTLPGQVIIGFYFDDAIKGEQISEAYAKIAKDLRAQYGLSDVKIVPVYKQPVDAMIRENISEPEYIAKRSSKTRAPPEEQKSFLASTIKVTFSKETDVEAFIKRVYQQKVIAGYPVAYCETVNPIQINYTPNDPLFDYSITVPATPATDSPQWGLIQAEAVLAWNYLPSYGAYPTGSGAPTPSHGGSPSVKIAIIDTGVDVNHEDLSANISYVNGQLDGYDTVDIDESYYNLMMMPWGYHTVPNIEDYHTPDNDPQDRNGHGTHCAGIAAAVTNNALGITGVAHHSKIMPVRAGFIMRNGANPPSEIGLLDPANIASAIVWATDNGADVVSMSFGGTTVSQAVKNAIAYANAADVVLVAAAGNSNWSFLSYPAAYDGVLAVAASDKTDVKAHFSNYGKWVDVSAPGVDILSTIPSSGTLMSSSPYSGYPGYKSLDGTSMAAPFVAGQAALVKSRYVQLSNQEICGTIMATTDPLKYLWYAESRKDILTSAAGAGNDAWDLSPYDLNFEGLLGTGRVNVKKSLVQDFNAYMGPKCKIHKKYLRDASNANVEAIPIGETRRVLLNVQNQWINASNVTAQIVSADGKAQIIQGSYSYGDLPSMDIVAQSVSIPFEVKSIEPLSQDFRHAIDLELHLSGSYVNVKTGASEVYEQVLPFTVEVGAKHILIVSDDPNFTQPGGVNYPQFLSIQSAINAAKDGDTIVVMPGLDSVYYERINFNGKKITVVGNPEYPESVTISGTLANGSPVGGQHGPVVLFNHNEGWGSTLKGFTITGGTRGAQAYLQYGHYYHFGGGICCVKATPQLENLIVTGNSGDSGGGIQIFDETYDPNVVPARMNLRYLTIKDNVARYQGGGIYVHRGNLHPDQFQLRVESCYLLHNQVEEIDGGYNSPENPYTVYGGAIHANGIGLTAWNTVIADNMVGSQYHAMTTGIAIGLLDTNLYLTHCTLMNNHPFEYPDIATFNSVNDYAQELSGFSGYNEYSLISAVNSLTAITALPYEYPDMEIRNSLIWEYHGNGYAVEVLDNPVAVMPAESVVDVTIEYSNIKNGVLNIPGPDPVATGAGNFEQDPQVIAPMDVNVLDRYYKIQSVSPCVDSSPHPITTGLSGYHGPFYDVEATPRPVGFRFDAGAYEVMGSASPMPWKLVKGQVWFDDDHSYDNNGEAGVPADYVYAYWMGQYIGYALTDVDGYYQIWVPAVGYSFIYHECGMTPITVGYVHTYPMAYEGYAYAYHFINGTNGIDPEEGKDFGIIAGGCCCNPGNSTGTKHNVIKGKVWFDADTQGDIDSSELPVINEAVKLTMVASLSGSPLGTLPVITHTDSNGEYNFVVADGIYFVSHKTGAPSNIATTGYWHTFPFNFSGNAYAEHVVVALGGYIYDERDFGIFKKGAPPPAGEARVKGRVWYDISPTDTFQVGENGVPQEKVWLTPTAGGAAQWVLTDLDGYYEFFNVVPGSYEISHQTGPNDNPLTAGHVHSKPTNYGGNSYAQYAVSIPSPAPATIWVSDHNDFGIFKKGTPPQDPNNVIKGRVWYDIAPTDAEIQTQESGVPEETVKLIPTMPVGPVQVMLTDSEGYYAFTNLAPGEYVVLHENGAPDNPQTAQYVHSCPVNQAGALAAHYEVVLPASVSSMVDDQDFGISRKVSWPAENTIRGRIWYDMPVGNGQIDPSESGVANEKVQLASVLTPYLIVAEAYTDSDGYYEFTSVPVGSWVVSHQTGAVAGNPQTQGYAHTCPAMYLANPQAQYLVVMGSSQVSWFIDNRDFGVWKYTSPPNNRIQGRVWYDTVNPDGVMQTNEDGVAWEKVKLTPVFGGTPSIVLTDPQGYYGFAGLFPGTYIVSHQTGAPDNTATTGYAHTYPSNSTALYEEIYTVTIGAGQMNLLVDDQDFGIFRKGMPPQDPTNVIRGRVWYDVSPTDAVIQSGESGVHPQKVKLTSVATSVVQEAFTDVNGYYQFAGVAAGQYLVSHEAGSVDNPNTTGYLHSAPVSASGNAYAQQQVVMPVNPMQSMLIDDIDFGIWITQDPQESSISGCVFQDNDQSHSLNPFTTGGPDTFLNGVMVYLYDATGTMPLDSDVTSGNGNYSFGGLSAGTYRVRHTAPAGFGAMYPLISTVVGTANCVASASDNNPTGTLFSEYVVVLGVAAGQDDVDFGEFKPNTTPPPGSLSGNVYHDLGVDGNLTGDPLSTVVHHLEVYSSTGVMVAYVATVNGAYAVPNLTPGLYEVFLFPAVGWLASTPDVLSNILVSSGQNIAGNDFGVYQQASISGMVFKDEDLSGGVFDPMIDGLMSGEEVILTDLSTNTVVATSTTDLQGMYTFTNVTPGNYKVSHTGTSIHTYPAAAVGNTYAEYNPVSVASGQQVTGKDFGLR